MTQLDGFRSGALKFHPFYKYLLCTHEMLWTEDSLGNKFDMVP